MSTPTQAPVSHPYDVFGGEAAAGAVPADRETDIAGKRELVGHPSSGLLQTGILGSGAASSAWVPLR